MNIKVRNTIYNIPTHGMESIKREDLDDISIEDMQILINRTRNNIWTRRFYYIRQEEMPIMKRNLILLREVMREKKHMAK